MLISHEDVTDIPTGLLLSLCRGNFMGTIYWPTKFGALFSLKARMPSNRSSVVSVCSSLFPGHTFKGERNASRQHQQLQSLYLK